MSVSVITTDRQPWSALGRTPGQVAFSGVMLFCIALGLGAALGRLGASSVVLTADPMLVQQQNAEVEDIRRKTENQLAALTARVATLQAEVNRLNMVGARLAEAAQLPEEAWLLQNPLPAGGPSQTDTQFSLADLNQVLAQLDSMDENIQNQQNRFALLESLDLNLHIGANTALSGRPVRSGYISSAFGVRTDPFSGEPARHNGVDFAGRIGEPILATAPGVVTWAGSRFGYGLMVEIEHADGYRTRYAHAKSVRVQVGEMVQKGQTVATLGNTGRSTAPHVHYEVLKDGKPVDPMLYLEKKTLRIAGKSRTAPQS